jgi:hypothetical protein
MGKSAEREFYALPTEVQAAFDSAFPEFARHPTRPTSTLVEPSLRDRAGRWRLRGRGVLRGIFRILQGRPDFELFETRDQVHERLRRFLASRGPEEERVTLGRAPPRPFSFVWDIRRANARWSQLRYRFDLGWAASPGRWSSPDLE